MRRTILAIGLVLAWSLPAWAVGPVLQTCAFDWGQPVTNADGTPLTNLASFNIYISTTAGGTGVVLGSLAAPLATPVVGAVYTFVCPTGITNGQKYGTVTALNTLGQESARSNEVPFVFGSLASPPAPPTTLSVRAVVSGPTLSSVPSAALHGATITVSVRNGPGNPTDWVALAPAGSALTQSTQYSYLNGSQTPPTVGLTTADFSFVIPSSAAPGAYELRLFPSNTHNLLLSIPFTVN